MYKNKQKIPQKHNIKKTASLNMYLFKCTTGPFFNRPTKPRSTTKNAIKRLKNEKL